MTIPFPRSRRMGSVEVLGVGFVCAAAAAMFGTTMPLGRLAPTTSASSSPLCRRSRLSLGASTKVSAVFGFPDGHGHVRHVRWSARPWTFGDHVFHTSPRVFLRAITDTSTQSFSDANDAVINRVAVLVSAATSIPIRETKNALSSRPELVESLTASVDEDDESRDTHGDGETTHGVYDTTRTHQQRDNSGGRTANAERRVVSVLRFLVDEVGLSSTDVAVVINKAPCLLAVDVAERARPVFAFMRSPIATGGAGLSKQNAAKCVSQDPFVLTKNDVAEVKRRFVWLTDHAGVRASDAFASRDGLRELRNRPIHPGVVGDSNQTTRDDDDAAENGLGCVFDFLVAEVGLGTDTARAVVRKYPAVLTKPLHSTLRPAFLVLRTNLDDQETVSKLVKRYPNVLTLSPGNLQKKFTFFSQTCVLTPTEITKVVANSPSVLTLSVELNLKPTWGWMVHDLGLGTNGARAVLTKAPSAFGLRLENLESKVNFLIHGAGKDAAVAIVTRAPGVLGTSLDLNIKPTVVWILETCDGLGYGDSWGDAKDTGSDAGNTEVSSPGTSAGDETTSYGTWDRRAVDVIQRQPSLLGMSVPNKLAPTVSFLKNHFPTITASTAFRACTFSLGGLVMPRVYILLELDLLKKWVPNTFLAWSVDVFCEKTGTTRVEYDAKVVTCKLEWERVGALDSESDSESNAILGAEKTPATLIRSAIRNVSTPRNEATPAERARARRAEKRKELESKNDKGTA